MARSISAAWRLCGTAPKYQTTAFRIDSDALDHYASLNFFLLLQISRDYNTSCFLRENEIFEWGPLYEFEACGKDSNGGKLIEEQPGDDNSLNREARK